MTTWTQITSLDAPTAGIFDLPSITFTGYTMIQVVVSGVTVTSDATDISLQFYVGGSAVATGYRWGLVGASSSAVDTDGTTSTTALALTSNDASQDVGNAAGEAFHCVLSFDEPLSTALHKKCEFESVMTNPSGESLANMGSGVMENTGAIEGFKIFGSSDLTAGKVRVLGLA